MPRALDTERQCCQASNGCTFKGIPAQGAAGLSSQGAAAAGENRRCLAVACTAPQRSVW